MPSSEENDNRSRPEPADHGSDHAEHPEDAQHSARPEHPELAAIAETIHADNEEVRRRWGLRPTLRIFMRIVIAVVGAVLGILIGGHTHADIGPIKVSADLLIGPGSATLRIPPLGTLEVDAYAGPVRLQMTVLQVDEEKASEYINGSKSLEQLTAAIEGDLKSALITLGVKTAIGAIVGGILLSLLLFRRWRDGLIATGTSLALIVATGVVGYVSFDAKSFQQPKYTGLLTQAPAIVGNVGDLAEKFADYRTSLVKLVTNISTLYTTVSTLPTDPEIADTIKVLHVSDIHMSPSGFDLMTNLAQQFQVDFVIDTGDLVDWGTPQESVTFSSIGALNVPYVFIRGNHDSLTTQNQVAAYSNVTVLDNDTIEIEGIKIAGVGDPRFSPDRTTYTNTSLDEAVEESALSFKDYLDGLDDMPDVVLFHDPASAEILATSTPLILSGHRHQRDVVQLDHDTLLMVQGSTGGAGLRGLEGEEPTPLIATVLYFDAETQQLRAWDDITVGGLGETDVSITRTLAPEAIEEAEEEVASMSASAESESASPTTDPATGPTDATNEPTTTEAPPQPTPTGAPPSPGE